MINHIRTLLLNRSVDGAVSSQLGEEYVPREFVPKAVTPAIRRWRQAVFGSQPDRIFLNFRLRQLMQLIHASPLEAEVYRDDPRVTYLPFETSLMAAGAISINQWAGDDSGAVVAGQFTANDAVGRSLQTWHVTVNNDLTVTVDNQTTRQVTEFGSHATTIALSASSLQLYLQQKTSGQKFIITAIAIPQTDLSQVLLNGVHALGASGLAEVFDASSNTDPVATWRRVWHKKLTAIDRYAALLLAIAARTASLPQEQPNE